MRDGRAGQRGIPATRGLSASVSACHRLGGEVTAGSSVRVSAGGGLGCFVLDVVPVFMLGLGLLSTAGLGWRSVSFCR